MSSIRTSRLLLLSLALTTTLLITPALSHNSESYCEGDFEVRSQSAYLYNDNSTANNTVLEGYLVVPKTSSRTRPGLVLVHQFLGISDFEKSEARKFAKLGYIVLLADIYGKGVRYSRNNATEIAQGLSTLGIYLGDRNLFRARVLAALEALRRIPGVDKDRVAIGGYCFGGTAALEAARSGTRLAKAFFSYHGGLSNRNSEAPLGNEGNLTYQKVLVLHGRDDPLISESELQGFMTEFKQADADIQFVSFSQTVHAFTDPGVDIVVQNFPNFNGAAAYNPRSNRRAHQYTSDFLQETFCRN